MAPYGPLPVPHAPTAGAVCELPAAAGAACSPAGVHRVRGTTTRSVAATRTELPQGMPDPASAALSGPTRHAASPASTDQKATFPDGSRPGGVHRLVDSFRPALGGRTLSDREAPGWRVAMLPAIYIVVRMTDLRARHPGLSDFDRELCAHVEPGPVPSPAQRPRRRHRRIRLSWQAFIAVMAASLFVHKIHVLIFGGGSTAGSNAARQDGPQRPCQRSSATPSAMEPLSPASAHGLRGEGDFFAIDSYWIVLSLDYGASWGWSFMSACSPSSSMRLGQDAAPKPGGRPRGNRPFDPPHRPHRGLSDDPGRIW